MANAVERLFDRVLSDISKAGLDHVVDWQDPPVDGGDVDRFDYPLETGGSSSYPIGDWRRGLRVRDMLRAPASASPEEKELIEGGIRTRGLDALAFYKSRRVLNQPPFPGKWGVFYLEAGLSCLADEIASMYPGYSDPIRLAHDFLLAHELFHYRCDLQTLMFEAVLQRNLYLPLRRALFGRRTHFVEEALANKQAFEWANKASIGLREFAFHFLSLQPDAYSRFSEERLDLNGEWLANTLDLQPPGCPPRRDIEQWVDATPRDLLRASLCPQHVCSPNRIEDWLDPASIPPPVSSITDGDKVRKLLSGKYRNLSIKWTTTKEKLIENRLRWGLNFKPWKQDGKDAYSVKIDDGYRAHLRHQGNGSWLAYILGSHKELGHG